MTATDRPTEPPVECVAVDRDERCLCPGGPASHRPSPPAPAAEDDAVEQRVIEALAAMDGRGYDVMARAALDAAGVSALPEYARRMGEANAALREEGERLRAALVSETHCGAHHPVPSLARQHERTCPNRPQETK